MAQEGTEVGVASIPRSQLSSEEDSSLLARSAGGDARAFAELVDRHGGAVMRYARSLSGSDAAAEDLVQQTFLSAYRAASNFRAESRVRTWLFSIARNAAWHQRKKEARYQPTPEVDESSLLELGLNAGWGAEDPETLAQRACQRKLLEVALAALPAQDREIVLLRDIEELSGAEVADVLGLSLAAMKSRLHRARLKLAGELRALTDEEASHA